MAIHRIHQMGDEERFICQRYVDNDFDDELTSKQVAKSLATFKQIISRAKCQSYIMWRALEKERKSKLDFNYKLYKLRRVIDSFIPDDLDVELKPKEAAVAISAIDQSNKMQGHFSAEKIINANINSDLDTQTAKRVMDELIAKHQKEY